MLQKPHEYNLWRWRRLLSICVRVVPRTQPFLIEPFTTLSIGSRKELSLGRNQSRLPIHCLFQLLRYWCQAIASPGRAPLVASARLAYITSAPASDRQIFTFPFPLRSSTFFRPHSNQSSLSTVILPSTSFIEHTSIIVMSSASLLSAKVASMAAATSAKAAGRSGFKLANSQRGLSGELPLLLLSLIASIPSLIPMMRCSLHPAIIAHPHSIERYHWLTPPNRLRPHLPTQHRPKPKIALPRLRPSHRSHQHGRPPAHHPPNRTPLYERTRHGPGRSRPEHRYRSGDDRPRGSRCRYRNRLRRPGHRNRPQPGFEVPAVCVRHLGVCVCRGHWLVRSHGGVHDSLHLDGLRNWWMGQVEKAAWYWKAWVGSLLRYRADGLVVGACRPWGDSSYGGCQRRREIWARCNHRGLLKTMCII